MLFVNNFNKQQRKTATKRQRSNLKNLLWKNYLL